MVYTVAVALGRLHCFSKELLSVASHADSTERGLKG